MSVETPAEQQQEKKRKLEVTAEPSDPRAESNEITISVYQFIKLQNNSLRYAQRHIQDARKLIKDKDKNNDDHNVYFNVSDECMHIMKEHVWEAKYNIERFLKDKPNARQTYWPAMSNFDEIIQDCVGKKLEWPEDKKIKSEIKEL